MPYYTPIVTSIGTLLEVTIYNKSILSKNQFVSTRSDRSKNGIHVVFLWSTYFNMLNLVFSIFKTNICTSSRDTFPFGY